MTPLLTREKDIMIRPRFLFFETLGDFHILSLRGTRRQGCLGACQ